MNLLKKYKVFLLVSILFLVTLTSCFGAKETFNDQDNNQNVSKDILTPQNTMLVGFDLSNQPYIVIEKFISDINSKILSEYFSIIGRDKTYNINYSDIGYMLDEPKIVENIKNGASDPLAYTYDETKLTDIINSVTENENIIAKETSIKKENGNLVITDGQDGSIIDQEQLKRNLESILNLDENEIQLYYVESSPEYTRDDFSNFQVIGSYSTNYNVYDTGRNQNLAQACNKINNSVVYPGEVFSTNDHYGETTIENGYAVAHVIVDNELVDGVGGGVCQVSTTLYNAVLRAELEIVERRNHSLQVGYAPIGFDATLANPYIDFKFRNNYDTPILVTAGLGNGTLTVSIYGKENRDPNRSIKFRSITTSTNEAGEVREDDDTLEEGKEVVEVTPINGQVVETYKDIYQDGELVDTQFVAKSNYSTRDAVIKVGTKEVEENSEVEEIGDDTQSESAIENQEVESNNESESQSQESEEIPDFGGN